MMFDRSSARLVVAAALLVAGGSLTLAQEWPQWRGPNRDGVAALPARSSWPARLTRGWQARVGIGYASPVVAGGRVFVHGRDGEQEVVRALDLRTGAPIWQTRHDAPYEMNPAARGHGKGPKSTPLVHEGRVYTIGIDGVLSAYDAATGAVAWRKTFDRRFPPGMPIYGAAMSPMVESGHLIAHVGTDTNGAIVALDPATGNERWAWSDDGPAYASPIGVEIDGVRQIVTQTHGFIVGLSADRGLPLWRVPFTTGFDQNIVTPLWWKDRLVLSGLDKTTFALKVARTESSWSTETLWEARQVPMYMSSPVLVGDRVYGLTHRSKGQLFCLDAASGRTLWVGEGRVGDNASLVAAMGAVLVLTSDGELLVIVPSDAGLEVTRRYEVADSATWASPAVTETGILIRDHETLSIWRW